MKQLQEKYKNEKKIGKRYLSQNAKEIRETGGGSAKLNESGNFGFSSAQVTGLTNRFDSDAADQISMASHHADQHSDNDSEEDHEFGQQLPKYSNKKMKLATAKNELIDLKADGLRLDNIHKELLIEKEKVLIENEKLVTRKLQLEILKLEKETAEYIVMEIP